MPCPLWLIEAYVINILPIETTIKHRSAAPARYHTFKLKVTFCVRGVISPLLANLYLHPLDGLMQGKGYRMVRYADDFVILCRTAEEAKAALEEVHAWVEANGLALHPNKTQVGDCRETGQGFDFLGYRFEAGRRWVRKKSLRAIRDKLRSRTGRTRGESLRSMIAEINPILKGWFGYFKHAHPLEFKRLDGFIRRRLRALLRKRAKRPGMGTAMLIMRVGRRLSSLSKGSSP